MHITLLFYKLHMVEFKVLIRMYKRKNAHRIEAACQKLSPLNIIPSIYAYKCIYALVLYSTFYSMPSKTSTKLYLHRVISTVSILTSSISKMSTEICLCHPSDYYWIDILTPPKSAEFKNSPHHSQHKQAATAQSFTFPMQAKFMKVITNFGWNPSGLSILFQKEQSSLKMNKIHSKLLYVSQTVIINLGQHARGWTGIL